MSSQKPVSSPVYWSPREGHKKIQTRTSCRWASNREFSRDTTRVGVELWERFGSAYLNCALYRVESAVDVCAIRCFMLGKPPSPSAFVGTGEIFCVLRLYTKSSRHRVLPAMSRVFDSAALVPAAIVRVEVGYEKRSAWRQSPLSCQPLNRVYRAA